MKPIWRNGKLSVELHKPDISTLRRARDIGKALGAMNQESGPTLVEAIDAILKPTVVEESES